MTGIDYEGLDGPQMDYRTKRFEAALLRLLRREVEELVKKKHGGDYLKERQAKTELTRVNRELKRLKAETAAQEERKSNLPAELAK